jgi:hypothetical protein
VGTDRNDAIDRRKDRIGSSGNVEVRRWGPSRAAMNRLRLTKGARRIVVRDVCLRPIGLDVRGHPVVVPFQQRRGREHQLRRHRNEGNDAKQPVTSGWSGPGWSTHSCQYYVRALDNVRNVLYHEWTMGRSNRLYFGGIWIGDRRIGMLMSMAIRARRSLRFLMLCLAALQVALPAAASVVDGSIARSAPTASVHVEDVARNTCTAHSPDCALCRILSVSFAQAGPATVATVEKSISVPPTAFVLGYSAASRQGFNSRAPPVLLGWFAPTHFASATTVRGERHKW